MTESAVQTPMYPTPEQVEQIETGPSLFRNRNFMVLWIGQTVSNIGSFFAFIALLFLTLRLSSDFSEVQQAQAVALVTIVQVIPVILIGPFSGVIVDRFDRKKIMIIADLLGAFASFSLVFVSSLNQVYALAGLYSLIRLFFYPARSAAIPLIVQPEKLMQANSLSQTTMQLSKIIGPALSGFVITLYGINSAFIIDGSSFLISVLMITMVTANIRPDERENALTVKSSLVDLKDGFVIVVGDKILRYVIILLVVFMIGVSMIDPLYAFYLSNEFGLGEADFGLIVSISAVVGFISAVALSVMGDVQRKLLFMIFAIVIGSVSILIIGYAPNLPVPIVGLYIGMAIVGMVNVVLMIPLSTLIQTIVSNKNMGKVNGIIGSLLSLTQVGGAAIAGSLVAYASVSLIYVGSSIFLLLAAFGLYLYRSIGGLEALSIQKQAEMMEIKKQEMQDRKNGKSEDLLIKEELLDHTDMAAKPISS